MPKNVIFALLWAKKMKKVADFCGFAAKNGRWGDKICVFFGGGLILWRKKPEDIADNGEHQVFSRCNWPVLCKTNSTHWWPMFQSSNNGGLMSKSVCVRGWKVKIRFCVKIIFYLFVITLKCFLKKSSREYTGWKLIQGSREMYYISTGVECQYCCYLHFCRLLILRLVRLASENALLAELKLICASMINNMPKYAGTTQESSAVFCDAAW